jgi:ABC-type phosphate transport system auxiliary subunit
MRNQEQVQARIRFLQCQLDALDHYLPETYQLLMDEMDQQQRELAKLKIQEFYQKQQDE